MSASRDGMLLIEPDLGGIIVRFQRSLPHPPPQVWARLVDRAHLHEWLTSEPGGHIRHFAGGEVFLPTIGGAAIDSVVDEFVPNEILAFGWSTYEWEGGEVVWELAPAEGGTDLTFDHADDDLGAEHFARLLANWHLAHDLFEASLAGAPQAWNWDTWQVHYRRYERKLATLFGDSW